MLSFLIWRALSAWSHFNKKQETTGGIITPAQYDLLNKNLNGDSRMSIIAERNGGYSGNSAKWGKIQISKAGT